MSYSMQKWHIDLFWPCAKALCTQVTISHYAMPNVSRQQRAGTLSAFESLSFLSEGAIFVYVGLDALDPLKWAVRASLPFSSKTRLHLP